VPWCAGVTRVEEILLEWGAPHRMHTIWLVGDKVKNLIPLRLLLSRVTGVYDEVIRHPFRIGHRSRPITKAHMDGGATSERSHPNAFARSELNRLSEMHGCSIEHDGVGLSRATVDHSFAQ